jgi:hypothetical protein
VGEGGVGGEEGSLPFFLLFDGVDEFCV